MAVDPDVRRILAASSDEGPAPESAADLRRMFSEAHSAPVNLPPIHGQTDMTISRSGRTMPARVYRPSSDRGLPALVWYHGGGWTIGAIAENDFMCRDLANFTGMVVVSVGYGLAPENPYPAAVLDCSAALVWVVEHASELGVDPSRVAVGGESAGGNISAVLAQRFRDGRAGVHIAAQLLVCPVVGHYGATDSYREFAEGYGMDASSMRFFFHQYLGDRDLDADCDVYPSQTRDLRGLPPAIVLTAENDVLRDEGEAYAERLTSSGVMTVRRRYLGQIHGFFGLYTSLAVCSRSHRDVAPLLRAMVDSAPVKLRRTEARISMEKFE